MKKRNRAAFLASSALFAAMLAIICPFVIPIGSIGITAATAFLLFLALTVKPAEAITATALYLALGAIGLPVFSYFTGGIGAFAAPSGGFLIGYLPFVTISALIRKQSNSILITAIAAAVAHLTLYLIGCAFFVLTTESSLTEALLVTVLPFLIPDTVKTILAIALSRLTYSRLTR